MRELNVTEITRAVAEMYVHANYFLGEDVRTCIAGCAQKEVPHLPLILRMQSHA